MLVDAVSGATNSSTVIKKAVENALTGENKNCFLEHKESRQTVISHKSVGSASFMRLALHFI